MRLSQLRVIPPPSTAYALSTADRKLTLSQSCTFRCFSRYYLKEYAATYFEAVELDNIVLLVVGIVGNG
ncbi:hypothetical protein M422DRAFT_32576 [Sphaerobolus stellatus SS14]|uniref:Unplaced genomic scaffold SPHSTscaffold_75, whole genome shotgun sequence n=1 Tax=Sphaerobolus stellatus (strain SS14) TaxID=990650 RepID=A0A0C9VPB0_SPHS4|nr:hypothetical protein M422DRAFT_32576 [Sphaerobolus stellatus SS14]